MQPESAPILRQIAVDRFMPDGRGESEAVASNASAEGRAMNRRVEFRKV